MPISGSVGEFALGEDVAADGPVTNNKTVLVPIGQAVSVASAKPFHKIVSIAITGVVSVRRSVASRVVLAQGLVTALLRRLVSHLVLIGQSQFVTAPTIHAKIISFVQGLVARVLRRLEVEVEPVRIVYVLPELREASVSSELRLVAVASEARIVVVEPEDRLDEEAGTERLVRVAAENRSVVAEPVEDRVLEPVA